MSPRVQIHILKLPVKNKSISLSSLKLNNIYFKPMHLPTLFTLFKGQQFPSHPCLIR